jgi:hypothetical protein
MIQLIKYIILLNKSGQKEAKMKKYILQLFCVLLLAGILSACQAVRTVFVNEPQEACDSRKVQQFNRIQWGMNHVKLGMDASEVQSHLGVADKWESFVLTDGREVQVMFYRTNYRNCGLVQSAWGEFLPMVLANGKLTGYGNNYYDGMIRPAITQDSESWYHQQKMKEEVVPNYPYGQQSYY